MAQQLTVFIDDSKDAKQEKFIIAAAVVGTKSAWNAFNREWRATLKHTPPIDYFHSSEWRGLKRQFIGFREQGKCKDQSFSGANAKRNALLTVIKKHLAAVSIAIDVRAWERVKADHPRPLVIQEDPYKTALQELIYAIAKDACVGKHKLSFVCDTDNRAHIYKQVYSNFRAKNPETAKKIIRSLMFADDETTYGLQAADLVAHIVNRVHQDYGLAPYNQKPPDELVGLMSNIHVWNYDYGMAVLNAQTSDAL